jgi:MFS transporter, ACS family, tartrate transporter
MEQIEARTLRKATLRLLPLLALCYFVAFLDRVNVGFAALTMNKDLGLSASAFGLGAGLFFITYLIFEVPSNLLCQRVGARRWIARIMLTWGLVSAAMAFINGETGFYVLRALLGVAEAGFFPGVLFFLKGWFPRSHRSRVVAYFMAAIPLASVVGSPISGFILGLDGVLGLAGWKWLFIIEALPALILAVVLLRALPDSPAHVAWLDDDERAWLARRLEQERQADAAAASGSAEGALGLRVVAMGVIYFGTTATNYALGFWLPQIVKGFGLTNVQTGLVSAIPFIVGFVSMIVWGISADRRGGAKMHLAATLVIAIAGLLGSALVSSLTMKMVALSFGSIGIYAALPTFWGLSVRARTSAGVAASIAAIGSIGSFSGFAVPYVVGLVKDATGSFSWGLVAIAAFAGLALVILGFLADGGEAKDIAPALPGRPSYNAASD